MLPSPLELVPLGANTHRNNHRSESISIQARYYVSRDDGILSLHENRTLPMREPSSEFIAVDLTTDTTLNNATSTIPPSDFTLLPSTQKKLIRKHRKRFWLLIVGFFLSLIVLVVMIALTIKGVRGRGGHRIWSLVVIAMLAVTTAMLCALKTWDLQRGRQERIDLEEGFVGLQSQREEREQREREREQCWVAAIRGREQDLAVEPERGRSYQRAKERKENTGAEVITQGVKITPTMHKDAPIQIQPPIRTALSQRDYIHQDLTTFRSESLNQYLDTEEARQRLVKKAAQSILARANLSPITPNSTDSLILKNALRRDRHPSHSSQLSVTAGMLENPFNTPITSTITVDDPWTLDAIFARPRSLIYEPSRSIPLPSIMAQVSLANPGIPERSQSLSKTDRAALQVVPAVTPCRDSTVIADNEDAFSETASIRERRRAQSVDRVRQWWAREKGSEATEGGKAVGRCLRVG